MKKPPILVGALVAGMIIGAFGVGYVIIPLQAASTLQSQDVVARTDRPFEAGATNGRLGYVETAAFASEMGSASSLDAALNDKPRDRTVPVYAVDGETVIGEYLISAGEAG